MTQVTDRLMTSDSSARRNDMVVQWRSVNVMQIVAMMMSDIGSSDRSPPSGRQRSSNPRSSRPVITSSNRVNANIMRSRNHPSEAIR